MRCTKSHVNNFHRLLFPRLVYLGSICTRVQLLNVCLVMVTAILRLIYSARVCERNSRVCFVRYKQILGAQPVST
jgi:hypothetical protein